MANALAVTDKDIVDAYHYMLGRWIVLRQERLDFEDLSRWNQLVHHAPGGVAWAHPNLDVATSDAWVFVDEASATVVELPEIRGRYYTVQLCNGWGEVVANINERTFPRRPYGKFVLCLEGAKVMIPPAAQRIDLPGRKARLLVRIGLGANAVEAIALQKRVTLKATGVPRVEGAVVHIDFTDDRLPGVEAFDCTEAILQSDPDVNGGMDVPQRKARAVAAAAAYPEERERIDAAIRVHAIPAFLRGLGEMEVTRDGWTQARMAGNHGSDYLLRSAANFRGLWGNRREEMVCFAARGIDGSADYSLTFPPDALPASKARHSWSVGAVDERESRVIPNPLDRFVLNAQSDLAYGAAGSLTLHFAPELPAGTSPGNWLPTPRGRKYNLALRYYDPSDDVVAGEYFPPARVEMS
jgi:hypothetical protein